MDSPGQKSRKGLFRADACYEKIGEGRNTEGDRKGTRLPKDMELQLLKGLADAQPLPTNEALMLRQRTCSPKAVCGAFSFLSLAGVAHVLGL
jgi:hypothetical protein